MDQRLEKYHLVSVPAHTFRGRKKRPGRMVFDPSTQRLGIFICYCAGCNSKILADKSTVAYLSKNIQKSKKRLVARVLMRAAKKLEP